MSNSGGGWITTKFGTVFDSRRELARGGEALLSVTADQGVISQEEAGRRDISSQDKSLYKQVHRGDIVYNTMRMWQGVSGVANVDGIVSPAYTVCAPKEGFDAKFLAWLLKRPAYISSFRSYSQGLVSDTWNLSFSIFAGLPLTLPRDQTEQELIANVLDTVKERIDSTQRVLVKTESICEGIAAAIWQHGTEWNTHYLDDIASIEPGLTLGSEPFGPNSVELPYLRVANVQNGYIDTTEMKKVRIFRNELSLYAARSGDVLLTEGGDFDKLGRGAVWDGRIDPCLHQNHIFRVRCNARIILPDFLALYTSSPAGRRYFLGVAKQTTNLASINSTQLKAMPVPVPPLRDQERLLRPVFEARMQRQHVAAELDKLRLLKTGLMEDLLTGRVRVTRGGELTGQLRV